MGLEKDLAFNDEVQGWSAQQVRDRAQELMNAGRVLDLAALERANDGRDVGWDWSYSNAHAQRVSDQNQANLKAQQEQQQKAAFNAEQEKGRAKRDQYWNDYTANAENYAKELENQAKYYQDPGKIQAALDLAQQRARASLASEYANRGLSGTSYSSRAIADATMATQESARKMIEERMNFANQLRTQVAGIKQQISAGAEAMYQYDENQKFNYSQLELNKQQFEQTMAENKRQFAIKLQQQEEELRRQQKSSIFSGVGTIAGTIAGVALAPATGGTSMMLLAGALGAQAGGTIGGIAGGGGGSAGTANFVPLAYQYSQINPTTTQPKQTYDTNYFQNGNNYKEFDLGGDLRLKRGL